MLLSRLAMSAALTTTADRTGALRVTESATNALASAASLRLCMRDSKEGERQRIGTHNDTVQRVSWNRRASTMLQSVVAAGTFSTLAAAVRLTP